MKRMIIVLLVAALVCGCVTNNPANTTTTTIPQITAERGDTVYVSYTGRLSDGKVFDTSSADVAKSAGIYESARMYEPLPFTLGENKVIIGFEDAIIGMAAGENKTVTIPPEQAYGKWDSSLVERINRTYKFPRIEDVGIDVFEKRIGKTPTEGMVFPSLSFGWNMTVVSVNGSVVETKHNPVNGAKIHIQPFGPAEVTGVDEDSFYIKLNPVMDSFINTQAGKARIMIVTDSVISLDFNHYLAGKTLTFEIKVENITKGT
jgi:peptidylprolyl isomerase